MFACFYSNIFFKPTARRSLTSTSPSINLNDDNYKQSIVKFRVRLNNGVNY